MKGYGLILTLLWVCIMPNVASAYPWFSPYSYCGGNPVNCVDPTGMDITVLNHTNGLHLAMLIQDETGKWQYYSINGDNVYISGTFKGGRPFNEVAVGSWDSPEEFLNSSYNVSKGDDWETDRTINNYGFLEGYHIKTTPEQDAVMRNGFSKIAKSEYSLFNNNCATAVQQVMVDAGIPVSEPTQVPVMIPMQTPFGLVDVINGYKMKCDISIGPKSAFRSIMDWNPEGKKIYKRDQDLSHLQSLYKILQK